MRQSLRQAIAAITMLAAYAITAHAAEQPYWVLFADRGEIDVERAVAAKRADTSEPKFVSRRARTMSAEELFDERDLTVDSGYVDAVRDAGGEIRHVTRYFNGVSVLLDDDEMTVVERLPFVRLVRPVGVLVRPEIPEPGIAEKPAVVMETELLPYGASFDQVNMVGATGLHDLGYRGAGILIAVLDNGFDNLGHVAFDSLTVAHARDFVDGDDTPEGGTHGTQVLSVMAGLEHGSLIGIAPDAEYVLARTEINNGNSDVRLEEDNWVAAVEWADSIGVDVINSSLGYLEFDGGFSYTYEDLDGETAVTTIAANIAIQRGMVVVTSAGNEGDKAWGYITTPADGVNVLAVGAVDRDGIIEAFSSHGPTSDGRIKPDVVALGDAVVVVSPSAATGYVMQNGTSFASPAVAGAAALLLETNPSWGPLQVRQAMFDDASRADNPDTDGYEYGYGAIDALASSGVDIPEPPVNAFRALDPFPQPAALGETTERIYFPIDVPEEGHRLVINIYSAGGDLVNRLDEPVDGSGELRTRASAPSWNGTNFTGDDVAPGVYFYTIELTGYGTYRGKLAVIR